MSTKFQESLCMGCSHLILKGVACDWRPGECAYLQENRQNTRAEGEKLIHYAPAFGLKGEFDAVPSDN